MIKRTIEISQKSAHIGVKLDQLLLQFHDCPVEEHASMPCEDIGLVMVDHPRTTYSHRALATLAEFGAVVGICGRDHLPVGLLLPLSRHTELVWRIEEQIAVSKPVRKRLWQQLVQSKIRGQAANLGEGSEGRNRLDGMAQRVRSGDPENMEAQAARAYWGCWSNGLAEKKFRRDANGKDPLNIFLNYGYAIMRAGVARALVSAGLLPMLGLHHSNRSNAFCLADDLIEPLRPLVDRRVGELYGEGHRELKPVVKAGLLSLLADSCALNGDTGPLMVQLHRMIASLVRCYGGESTNLDLPDWPSERSGNLAGG